MSSSSNRNSVGNDSVPFPDSVSVPDFPNRTLESGVTGIPTPSPHLGPSIYPDLIRSTVFRPRSRTMTMCPVPPRRWRGDPFPDPSPHSGPGSSTVPDPTVVSGVETTGTLSLPGKDYFCPERVKVRTPSALRRGLERSPEGPFLGLTHLSSPREAVSAE